MELRERSRTLGLSVRSVYRYKDLEEPPPRPAHKRRASVLGPYAPYPVRRWNFRRGLGFVTGNGGSEFDARA